MCAGDSRSRGTPDGCDGERSSAARRTPLMVREVSFEGSSLLAQRVQAKTSPTKAVWKDEGKVRRGARMKGVEAGLGSG